MPSNIYLKLTEEFNAGRLRAVICSGQAVVLHRVAIMSKDGDWIIREDEEACQHLLVILEGYGAYYRFGAPLDLRWLSQGWSSHFEFRFETLRVRTDFFSRPPRIDEGELLKLWQEQEHNVPPYVDLPLLARMKQTDREKDYVVIGELARRMKNPADQLLYSRSALDLLRLAEQEPSLVASLSGKRPLLTVISTFADPPAGGKEGRLSLEAALDTERRDLIHANERRLARFEKAAERWRAEWPEIVRRTHGLSLSKAHQTVVQEAESCLPRRVL